MVKSQPNLTAVSDFGLITTTVLYQTKKANLNTHGSIRASNYAGKTCWFCSINRIVAKNTHVTILHLELQLHHKRPVRLFLHFSSSISNKGLKKTSQIYQRYSKYTGHALLRLSSECYMIMRFSSLQPV